MCCSSAYTCLGIEVSGLSSLYFVYTKVSLLFHKNTILLMQINECRNHPHSSDICNEMFDLKKWTDKLFCIWQQESILVGCVPPTCHRMWGSLYGGGRPDRDPPRQKSPEQIPLDRDPPRRSMGPGSQTGSDIIQRPPCEQTNTCENITLLQTSFVGGNNYV